MDVPPVELLNAPSGVVHATRHATAAASSHSDESVVSTLFQLHGDVAMGSPSNSHLNSLSPPPSTLLPMITQEMISDVAITDSKSAGLKVLGQPDIWTALRTAMAVQGDQSIQPPTAVRSWLADRYIHERIVVDQHTAGAILYEAFSQSRVFVVRNFPGTYPAPYSSVSEYDRHPRSQDDTRTITMVATFIIFSALPSQILFRHNKLVSGGPKSTFCQTPVSTRMSVAALCGVSSVVVRKHYYTSMTPMELPLTGGGRSCGYLFVLMRLFSMVLFQFTKMRCEIPHRNCICSRHGSSVSRSNGVS